MYKPETKTNDQKTVKNRSRETKSQQALSSVAAWDSLQ